MSSDKLDPFCSFCKSANVVLMSPFGTAQLVKQYYCNDCRSAFEFIRWQDEDSEDRKE